MYQSGTANLQKTFIKVFNFALREMKSGALCAIVDASHQHLRQKSIDHAARYQVIKSSSTRHSEYNTRKKSQNMKNALLRGCESLSFMLPRAISFDYTTTTTTTTSVSPPSTGNSRGNEIHPKFDLEEGREEGFPSKPTCINIGDLEKLHKNDSSCVI